jgi:PAS domain S-box-containing protein
MTATSPLPRSAFSDSERFQYFVASVADYAIYMLSSEGYVESWNAGAQRFKGYSVDEIVGRHFSLFYTEEDRAAGIPAKALKTALEQGKFEDEGWRVRKDGSRFWASVVLDPVRDPTGRLIGFAKITRDITERKQAQDALRSSEEQFRLLIEGVTDYAIYMLSPAGEVTNWNTGAQRIKGYSKEEIVGTHFSRFYSNADRVAGLPAITLETAIREGRFESEGWRVRKDGSRFWAHVVVDAIHNDMGELVGFAKITRDITERREAAEALERTKEALFQSQKLESIGKLTGGIAHDFNNLLGVIINGVDLLAREVQSPAGVKILDSMQRAASRGAKLTGQLLAFARRQPLRQERHNLSTVIASFEAVLRRACNVSIKFDVQLEQKLSDVLIDDTQFEAALLNLVSNARDAMPDGGRLTVKTENVELGHHHHAGKLPPGQYVKVSVSDTGTGMPPDVMARAVEPFFTTKEIGKGTGMGLSQAYGLTQQSDGDLELVSEVGKGTTVSMYLPALEAATDDETRSDEMKVANDKALVVDDQPDVLDLAIALFRDMGYDVLSANNAADAVEIMKRTPDVDVLFSDVVMPGMSGIALGLEARRLVPGIKVVLASGYPVPALDAEKAGLEQFGFVSKPYRMAEVVKQLRRAR